MSMEPIPAKTERPPKLNPESKPATGAETKPPQQEKPSAAIDTTTPHGVLEAIAGGTPASEVFAKQDKALIEQTEKTSETPPDKEKVTKLLEESNALLLELRDMRLLVTAVATQAADTPLGNETRMDALRMVRDMKPDGVAPDQLPALTALQERLTDMNLPDAQPAESPLLPIISNYNEMHPDMAIPPEVVDQITTGERGAAESVAQFMQSHPDLAQDVWKQLTNVDGFTGLHPTPTNILQLSGLPTTPENMAKAEELFGMVRDMQPVYKEKITEALLPHMLGGALLLMFLSQTAMGGESGGGGH